VGRQLNREDLVVRQFGIATTHSIITRVSFGVEER
jgi:hypothetical protein